MHLITLQLLCEVLCRMEYMKQLADITLPTKVYLSSTRFNTTQHYPPPPTYRQSCKMSIPTADMWTTAGAFTHLQYGVAGMCMYENVPTVYTAVCVNTQGLTM